MKTKKFVILFGLSLIFIAHCMAQIPEEEEKGAIIEVIKESYIGAAHNNIDIDVLKKGFHERYNWQGLHHGSLMIFNLRQWIILLNRDKELRPEWHNRTTADIKVIGLEGNTAVVRVDVFNDQIRDYTDFLSMYMEKG